MSNTATRIQIEKAERLASTYANDPRCPSVDRLTEVAVLVADFGRETGMFLDTGRVFWMSDDEIRAEMKHVRSQKNGRKGFASLMDKRGYGEARRIVHTAYVARGR